MNLNFSAGDSPEWQDVGKYSLNLNMGKCRPNWRKTPSLIEHENDSLRTLFSTLLRVTLVPYVEESVMVTTVLSIEIEQWHLDIDLSAISKFPVVLPTDNLFLATSTEFSDFS